MMAEAAFRVVLAREICGQRPGACRVVPADRGSARNPFPTREACRRRAVFGAAAFAELHDVPVRRGGVSQGFGSAGPE
jgi:hypothetical protein